MKSIITTALLVISLFTFAQKTDIKKDTIKLNEVLISATRVTKNSPFAFTTISKEALEPINLGQDLPILLDQMPSVVTTSDAGSGVGYTGIRIRGSDATRINVTLNGIPFNDSESQGTFWVNLPDITSSVEDIQIQRGVGTSTNGPGAFGASINIKTKNPSQKGYATTSNGFGSFNTRKHNISFGSGINKNFYAEGRISKILSDGYIDRATSDLSSYFTEVGYLSKKTSVKVIVFGGHEITYQSWNGAPKAVVEGDIEGIQAYINRNFPSDAEAESLLNDGRTYNFYTYDNQVDNYEQTHYQLHFTHRLNTSLSVNLSGNYTRGKGYFEQFKDNEEVGDYFPNSTNASEEGDVIRRRWLDNDFYVLVYSLNYIKDNLRLDFGGSYSKYDGDHFGEIIWDSFNLEIPIRSNYYFNIGEKKDFSTYIKASYDITSNWFAFADLQYRNVSYIANGISSDLLNIDTHENFNFINPKLGLTYKMNNYNLFYTSYAVANREPNRDDLIKNTILPKAENLQNIELGYRFKKSKLYANANFYYMNYKDQLVLTGEIDDVGDAIRQNVAESYRLGLEVQMGYKLNNKFRFDANITLSDNKIKEFNHIVYDTQHDTDFNTISTQPVITNFKNTDISFSPNIIAGNTITYSPLKDLNIGFISKYVGKQYLDNTSSDSKSINAYFVNNLNVSYKVNPKWIKEISFNLLVNNFLNEKYVSNGYTFSYFYRPENSNDNAITEVFYYPQATINFLTGITLKF